VDYDYKNGLKARRLSDFKAKVCANFQGNTTEDTHRVFNNRYQAPEAESGIHDSSIRLSMSDTDSYFKNDFQIEEQFNNAVQQQSQSKDSYHIPTKQEAVPNFKYYGFKPKKQHRYYEGSDSSGDGIHDTSENPNDNKMHMVTRSICKNKLVMHNLQRQHKRTNY
jgi:hypothetical protein